MAQLFYFFWSPISVWCKHATCRVFPHIDILAQAGAPVARLLFVCPVLAWPGVAPVSDLSWPAALGPRRVERLAFLEGLQGFTMDSPVAAMPAPMSPGSQSSGSPPARPNSPRSRSPHQVALSPPVYEDETHQWCRNPTCPKKKKFKKNDTLEEAEKQHFIHSKPCRAYAPACVVKIIEEELQAMEAWLQANPPVEREKPFICNVCNRAFEWPEALQQHKDSSEKCRKRAAEQELLHVEQGQDHQWWKPKEDASLWVDAGWTWHNKRGDWGSDRCGGSGSDAWSWSRSSDSWSGAGGACDSSCGGWGSDSWFGGSGSDAWSRGWGSDVWSGHGHRHSP